ncbi:MAG: DEAD/DEAH box helicase [Flavobacteriales bacterium]|nr:DEAD/DEAH box helicase [Flavobacteriales bacterium]
MRIPAEARYVLVYSIEEYDLLGHILEPHIVQLTSAGNLSLQNQRIHINNADFYDKALDTTDYQAIALLSEITPEALTKKFSKTPRIRPKEFFAQKSAPELIEKFIRPYIEQKIAEVLTLIQDKPLYLKEGKHVTAVPIHWPKEPAEILFHLRRNDDDVHYFPSIRYLGQKIELNRTNAILLSLQPCYLVNSDQLYVFNPELDGNKIRPFLTKRFIRVPRENELKFLKTFIAPLFERHNLYAKGYEVETLKVNAIPVVKAGKLINGDFGLVLYFKYGNHTFPYHSKKHVSVTVEARGDTYALLRVRRSIEWEEQKMSVLLKLGGKQLNGSEFFIEGLSGEADMVNWIQSNRATLDAANFHVAHTFNSNYNLNSSNLELEFSQNGDWFDVYGKVNLCGFEISFQEVARFIKSGKREFPLPDGSIAVLPQTWFERLADLVDFSSTRNQIRISRLHRPILENAGLQIPDLQIDGDRVPEYPIPSGFNGTLRTYQKAGYDWLRFLDSNGLGGCLADDMGLGKTIQTLAFLQWVKDEYQSRSVQEETILRTSLLVVPTSLVHNWISEASRFTPGLRILNHTGQGRVQSIRYFGGYDLVVTTYGSLRNDIDWLKQFKFRLIALDEAQMIKNPESKIASVVAELQGALRITLTGTPVENSVRDLWSQMNFVNRGLLGTQRFFVRKFQQPIERNKEEGALLTLRKLIAPFVLRRTKKQVANDLPDKSEQIVYCEMSEEQAQLYEQVKSQYRNLILDLEEGKATQQVKFSILSGLTKLRLIANAPELHEEGKGLTSGKFELVSSNIETAVEEGHKLLIFSQFVKHLSLYKDFLDDKQLSYAYIDGSTPQKERQAQVDYFQDDTSCHVLLISLKAGGYGLNLTAADYVFLLDPWWNPAVENQAIDRTHRIGQSQKVFGYRFISSGSIEEKILALQEKKRSLSDALVQTDESIYKSLSIEDIKELLS